MAVATLKIIPGTLPPGYCYPSNPQILNNDILTRASVSLSSSSFTVIITSGSQPPATDRDKLWMNTVDDRIYRWSGAWRSRHPLSASSKVRYWYLGTLTDLETFDGGEAGVPAGASVGPMWEEDTDFIGRIPLHVGALPTSGTVTALNDTGGVDQITLTPSELPEHQHLGKAYYRSEQSSAGGNDPSDLGDNTEHESGGHTASSSENWSVAGVLTTSMVGDTGEAIDTMNPYRTGYWIKRTVRAYYKAS